jgi:hypothetical protein
MQIIKLTAALAVLMGLSGCLDTDAERALAGAGAGIVVAETTGGNAVVGGVAGAAAGVFCDDVGICKPSR